MRAVAGVLVSIALLALVAVGFSTTVRVCEPPAATAGEPRRNVDVAPLIAAVPDEAKPVAAVASPPVTYVQSQERLDAPTDGRSRADAGTDAGGGGLELHNLSVWDPPDDSPYVYLSFSTISLESFSDDVPSRLEMVDGEEVEVADVDPTLDEDHVSIELDGQVATMSSLYWYYAGYGDLGGADMKYIPVCLIRIDRPDLSAGEHELRLRIEDVDTGAVGEGRATFECRRGIHRLVAPVAPWTRCPGTPMLRAEVAVDEQTRYERARKRVEAIRGFYQHLMAYVLINPCLFVLNLLTSPGDWWFFWPLFGWGIGLVAHAASVFGIGGLWGEAWEERKIKQLLEKS